MEGNKENPSKEELKRREALKEMINDYVNGGELSIYLASTKNGGNIPDAAGLLRINGKNSSLDIRYTRKAIKYNNSDELPDKYKNIIKEKISSQPNLDKNMKGLFFNSDSELSKRIALTPQIISKIKEQKGKIKLFCDYNDNNKPIKLYSNTNVQYGKSESRNLYYAFHKADIYNLKYDMFGNISGDLIDTTDFNAGQGEPILVQKAKELQDEGKIEPKFVIVHFVVPKNIVMEKVLNEKYIK